MADYYACTDCGSTRSEKEHGVLVCWDCGTPYPKGVPANPEEEE